jgi:hypothetical protein
MQLRVLFMSPPPQDVEQEPNAPHSDQHAALLQIACSVANPGQSSPPMQLRVRVWSPPVQVGVVGVHMPKAPHSDHTPHVIVLHGSCSVAGPVQSAPPF